jgi:pilus assembly protein CpaB
MRSKGLILAAAALLGILAAFGAGRYLDAVRGQALAGAKPVEVLVATQDIPKGTPSDQIVSKKMAEARAIPQQYVAANAISSARAVDGQVLAVPLSKGEQVTATRFQFSSDAGLAFEVPSGMVAISLSSDEVRGVAGLVKPGDNVAIVVSMKTNANDDNTWQSRTLIAGTRVLATGSMTSAEAPSTTTAADSGGSGVAFARGVDTQQKTQVPSTITVALSPADMERVVLAQEIGRVWLALLPTQQQSIVHTSGQQRATLLP